MRRLALFALASSALATGSGCQTRCESTLECGPSFFCNPVRGVCESECFSDDDCRAPPDCPSADACKPRGLWCSAGRCTGPVGRPPSPPDEDPPPVRPDDLTSEGWDLAPGESGVVFAIADLWVADPGLGFDLDNRCDGAQCYDNALGQLGSAFNPSIRQGFSNGSTIVLLELAGLDVPYTGNDPSLTLKIYAGRDADFAPYNNFSNADDCCRFEILEESRQRHVRIPARIERGLLDVRTAIGVELALAIGPPPHPVFRLERTHLAARVPPTLRNLESGLLGGAAPLGALARISTPYCELATSPCGYAIPEASMLDLIAQLYRPDVDLDLDPDGLEGFELDPATHKVARCLDGCAGTCSTPPEVPPLVPDRPGSCTQAIEMADGYSVAFSFRAVRATIVP